MIKGIAGGQGIVVSGGSSAQPYIDSTRPSAGIVRYIGNNMEIYDGSGWQILSSSYSTIDLSPDVHELLQWAKRKRDEEYRLKDLIRTNPNLEAAYSQLIKSQEQLDILVALVKEHNI